MQQQKNIVFLSSSFVNLAKIFAKKNREYDVFLILDRKFPFEMGDDDIDNFYSFIFEKSKLYEKDKKKYFDNLSVFIHDFEPDLIITNNFTKLLPKEFIDFFKFRNSKMKLINIHNADLRILNEKEKKYKGLYGDRKQFLDEEQIVSTIHHIKDEKMDEGEQIAYSKPTTLEELKLKKLVNNPNEILNLRIKNVIISYHERTKVLNLLRKVVKKLIKQ